MNLDTNAHPPWNFRSGLIPRSKLSQMQTFASFFAILLLAQVGFALSQRIAGDPFAEPYVSHQVEGHAVELGWPLSYAKCIQGDNDTTNSGPWTSLTRLHLVELSMSSIFIDVVIIVFTAFSGASLSCFLKDRLKTRLSIGLLLSIMSVIALNLITQNAWLARTDLGLLEKVEHLFKSYSEYLTWYCTYSACFVFVWWSSSPLKNSESSYAK